MTAKLLVSTLVILGCLTGCGVTPTSVTPKINGLRVSEGLMHGNRRVTPTAVPPQIADTTIASHKGKAPSSGMTDRDLHRLFDEIDANHDGVITFDELMNANLGQPVDGWKPGEKERQAVLFFEKADTHHDGRVTFDEVEAAMTGQPMTGVPQQ